MRTHSKLLLTSLAAAIVLSAAVGSVSARRLEISNTGIRVTWQKLRFVESGNNAPEVECPVTLEGTFHSRTISKVSGQLIGYITSARLTRAQCTLNAVSEVEILNGNGRGPTTLPWHIRYNSFEGALPNIVGVRLQLINVGFLIGVFGGLVSCLYLTTAMHPAIGIVKVGAAGLVTALRTDETQFIPLHSGPAELCPPQGKLEDNGAEGVVTLLNTTTRITIRLVA